MKGKTPLFENSHAKSKFRFKLNLQLFAEMPKQKAQIMHIMCDRPGHMIETPENTKILVDLSNDQSSFISAKHGNDIFSKIINGKEYWVYVRDGIIQNGGVNLDNFRFHKKGDKTE